jgi:hypothetical protein
MRMVNGADALNIGKQKGAGLSRAAQPARTAREFLALLQQNGVGQVKARPSSSVPLTSETPVMLKSATTATASTSLPGTGTGATNAVNSSFMQELEAIMAPIMDPVNQFNSVISSNDIPMANNVAWYENNGLAYPTQLNWREMMDSRSRVLTSAHNQVALKGRMTPEIDAKYREAMGEIEQFRQDRQAGIEPPVPRQFQLLLRSGAPLTRDQIRERVTEYLKSPLLNDGTARRVADLELARTARRDF